MYPAIFLVFTSMRGSGTSWSLWSSLKQQGCLLTTVLWAIFRVGMRQDIGKIKNPCSRFHFNFSAFHFKNFKGDKFFNDTTTTNIHSIPFFFRVFLDRSCAPLKVSPLSLLWWAVSCALLGETVIRSLESIWQRQIWNPMKSNSDRRRQVCRQKKVRKPQGVNEL